VFLFDLILLEIQLHPPLRLLRRTPADQLVQDFLTGQRFRELRLTLENLECRETPLHHSLPEGLDLQPILFRLVILEYLLDQKDLVNPMDLVVH